MARTFNETVPSVTDVFESVNIKETVYKFFQEAAGCTCCMYSDVSDGVFLMNKNVFLSILHNLLFHTNYFNGNAQNLWERMNEFIDSSESEYIVYE